MKKSLLFLLFICLSFFSPVRAQLDSPHPAQSMAQLGGNNYVYTLENPKYTKVPTGYKTFYISHYGRHGSRWLISDKDYTNVLGVFQKAYDEKQLTALGEDVYQRLIMAWNDANGRTGELTPLGAMQHRGIAERMVRNYPEVFCNSASIQCRSTNVTRCILSMAAFTEQLAAMKPKLKIDREACLRDMPYMNPYSFRGREFLKDSVLINALDDMQKRLIHPERVMSALFIDGMNTKGIKDFRDVMEDLYNVSSNLQGTELKISLNDVLLPNEMYDLWQYQNYRFYLFTTPSSINQGIPTSSLKPLLSNFIDCANEAIQKGVPAANLRFGHDTNILSFTALMGLDGCCVEEPDPMNVCLTWKCYEIIPMAANVQWIFYRKKGSDDILVKFLLNEQEKTIPIESDVKPYYHWRDVEAYFRGRLDK